MEASPRTALVAEQQSGSGHARIFLSGSRALLLDVADGAFNAELQRRLWSLSQALSGKCAPPGVGEVFPGVNNMMVLFDPLQVDALSLAHVILTRWDDSQATQARSRMVEIPVVYGGAVGEDLEVLAERAALDVRDYVQCHSEAEYFVACLGAMPGFAYLVGLPARLAVPRRNVPRLRLPKGAVIIGGSQAAIFPSAGPCGWHVLGSADVSLFDPRKNPPCVLAPGDIVRFAVKAIEPVQTGALSDA